MSPKENFKDVTIQGRTFRVKKFSALTGGFMLVKIVGILAPFFKSVDVSKFMNAKNPAEIKIENFNFSGVMEQIGNLQEKDFLYVQEKCLQVCSEVLPSGLTPVMTETGAFGVIGIEEDTMTVLSLTVHTLIFNVTGFFGENPLGSMLGGLLNTSQPPS